MTDAPTGAPTATLPNGDEDTPTPISLSALLEGFTDPNSDPLSVVDLTSDVGTVEDNGDGTATLTTPLNFNGAVTLTYGVSDGSNVLAGQTRPITIDPVNDAPDGEPTGTPFPGNEDDPSYIVSEAILLEGFSDVEGDSLSVTGITSSLGTVVREPSGEFFVDLPKDFNGEIVFTYGVSDGTATLGGQTLTATINPLNDAPEGSPAGLLPDVDEDETITIPLAELLDGFSDVDGDDLDAVNVAASVGILQPSKGGGFTLTPPAEFNGEIVVSYDVTDGTATLADQSLSVMVNAVNDLPELVAPLDVVIEPGADGLTITSTSVSDMDDDRLTVTLDADGTMTLGRIGGLDFVRGDGLNDATMAFSGTVADINNALAVLTYTSADETAIFERIEITVDDGGAELVRGGIDVLRDVPTPPPGEDVGDRQEDDVLIGDGGDNVLRGGAGNDTLSGDGGDDTLNGGIGDDNLSGGEGRDTLNGGAGNDQLFGAEGADELNGQGGNDEIFGGEGRDILRGAAGGDTLYGGLGGDELFGGLGGDVINAQGGNDRAFGQGGDDVLNGGAGRDELFGGGGRDILNGGAGGDSLYGGLDTDLLEGGAGNDFLFGQGGNDLVFGDAGDDRLNGAAGSDLLVGGTGSDTLNGGAGTDILAGEDGNDVLVGQAGLDTFVFFATDEGADTVLGFEAGETVALVEFDYASEAEAAADFQQVGDNVVFTYDGGSATFTNATLGDVVAGIRVLTEAEAEDLAEDVLGEDFFM